MLSLADLLPRRVHCQQALWLDVDADALWAVVGDLGSLVPAGGMVERIELEGAGAGAVRTFHLPGGPRIVERIEDHDPALRRYVYRILDSGPLPIANYLGVAQVAPAGPGAAILSWSAMADPVRGDAEALRAMLQANLETAVRSIAAHFGCAVG
jgi:hypothetical protein